MPHTKFGINPIVKAYIISDAFLWSGWNFVMPIFAIFVVNNIAHAPVQIASIGYSIYLISRVVFELISGQLLRNTHDRKKIFATIIGITLISVAYIGFSFSTFVLQLFLFYVVAGMGLGIAAPAKNALFAIHLDKNKESSEWSLADAVAFICMALASTVGGFIAVTYGFKTLFILAACVNLISIIPYILYIYRRNHLK